MSFVTVVGESGLKARTINWETDDIRARIVKASETVTAAATVMTGIGEPSTDIALSGRSLVYDAAQKRLYYRANDGSFGTVLLTGTPDINRVVIFKRVTNDADSIPIAVADSQTNPADGRLFPADFDSEGLIWVDLDPADVVGGDYPPATYSRASGLTSDLNTAKANIVRRDAAGNPSGTGYICVLGLGMSIGEDCHPYVKEAIRYGTMNSVSQSSWLPARAAGLVYQFGSDSGKVADNWANPDDPCWAAAIAKLGANYIDTTAQQVQHIHIHLTQSWPSEPGWRDGSIVDPIGWMTASQINQVIANAKSKFPNLVSMDLHGIPWTGNSTSGQVPIDMVHADDALLATRVGLISGVYVDYLQVYAESTTFNTQHTTTPFPSGLNWVSPDDYDTDNVHQSVPTGVVKLAKWMVSRWAEDPVKSWMWA